jgi:hypothetical protein
MARRLIQVFVALALVTVGLAAIVTSPTSPVWGGCNNANVALKPCVNFGADGGNVRADFYLGRTPDPSVHHYKVYLVVNGVSRVGATGTFDHTGRYCCWYWDTHSSIGTSAYKVYTRVYVYTSSGAQHMVVDSPAAKYAS